MQLAKEFLPVSKEDLKIRNIKILDFIIVTGDAYVDHPSFGAAIIGRILESQGFTVGIISQPSWKDTIDFKKLGQPRYGFLVNSGNIDSMVNHYTVSKKKRRDDLYSPGGKGGFRPDRALIVYCNRIKEAYRDTPIIIGGIEASLRRFAHYDYWDNKVRRSILLDTRADLLVYGMGEKTIIQIAELLRYGKKIENITGVRGTAYSSNNFNLSSSEILLPSCEEVTENKKAYGTAYKHQYLEQDPIRGRTLIQKHGNRYVVQNPPQNPLTQEEMNYTYNLPFKRAYHPMYEKMGGIPAISEVKFSITSHRGCFGSCSFCALTYHQGRIIQNRSEESILEEAELLTNLPDFKGYIHDVGGPTANFRNKSCIFQAENGACRDKQCMFPHPCKNLKINHKDYLAILRRIKNLPKVKKVFIRSGIRYDYLIHDSNTEFFKEMVKDHISGQLKVAPEHISDKVLSQMGKPSRKIYDKFTAKYYEINKSLGKNQFLVPYLMSSHPGSDLNAAIELALYIKEMNYTPEQVQDFYPTPGSISTTMYYTGFNPLTEEKVYVPKDPEEKQMQRALLQFKKPENHSIVKKALLKAGREDLIGHGAKYLIDWIPEKFSKNKNKLSKKKNFKDKVK